MSKPVKDMITNAIQERCVGVDSACVVDISGLDAISTNSMRGELLKQSIHMHVVKNSLAIRAFKGGPLEPLARSLEGPCALVYGDPAVTDIAKELVKWAKQHKVIKLKNGIIEGDPGLVTVDDMARMKGKIELVGDIAMLISSPGRSIAGAISSPAGKIAGCLKTMIEDHEKAA